MVGQFAYVACRMGVWEQRLASHCVAEVVQDVEVYRGRLESRCVGRASEDALVCKKMIS